MSLPLFLALTHFVISCSGSSELAAYQSSAGRIAQVKSAMLASIRTSWEQGTAAGAVLEIDSPEYSVFGNTPFQNQSTRPDSTLQLALSAVVRQSPDGRLSQIIGDGLDGAALDGASSGPAVLLGTYTDDSRKDFWQKAADAQLNFLLTKAPKTSHGAISHRIDSRQYWADGVYVGFPFIAAYGAITSNQTLLQIAYENCRLYHDALIQPGPHGPLWAHVFSDDTNQFIDQGLWGTGNAWAAKGMLQVQMTIINSPFKSQMTSQINDLKAMIKEILDGAFPAIGSDNLIPDYIAGNSATFGDSSSSAALVSVAYRSATLFPKTFGKNYTDKAAVIRDAVISGINDLGLLSPLVDPLVWDHTGVLSTEGQAFGLMMFAAWRDWGQSTGQM